MCAKRREPRPDRVVHLEVVPDAPEVGPQSSSVASRVLEYTPDLGLRGLSEATWEQWAPALRARATVAAANRGQVSPMLGNSLSLLAWALSQKLPLKSRPELLWTPNTLGRYLKHLESTGISAASVVTAKSHLTRMAEAAVPDAAVNDDQPATAAGVEDAGWALIDARVPVPVGDLGLADAPAYWDLLDAIGARVRSVHPDAVRPGSSTPGRDRAIPYGRAEVSRLLRAAPTLPVESTRSAAKAYLALGLGAGIEGVQLSLVQPGDIQEDPNTGAVTVDVRGNADTVVRRVPVLAPFAPLLLELRAAAGERPLLRGRNGNRAMENRPSHLATSLANKDPHAVRADSTRLRATWLTVHLACGTPLKQLLEYTGLTTIVQLQGLLDFVPVTRRDAVQPWTDLHTPGSGSS